MISMHTNFTFSLHIQSKDRIDNFLGTLSREQIKDPRTTILKKSCHVIKSILQKRVLKMEK